MEVKDWIAVYAAVVSTAVMIWDVCKWRREKIVKLDGAATPGMEAFGSAVTPITKGRKYVAVRVANQGSLTCEVTHLVLLSHSNAFNRWRGKNNGAAFVADPVSSVTQCRLPFTLEPGKQFMGMIEQTAELEDWSRRENLYAGVIHSLNRRPYLMRIEPIQPKQ
jgi:hypothetical protein